MSPQVSSAALLDCPPGVLPSSRCEPSSSKWRSVPWRAAGFPFGCGDRRASEVAAWVCADSLSPHRPTLRPDVGCACAQTPPSTGGQYLLDKGRSDAVVPLRLVRSTRAFALSVPGGSCGRVIVVPTESGFTCPYSKRPGR